MNERLDKIMKEVGEIDGSKVRTNHQRLIILAEVIVGLPNPGIT